MKDLIELIQLSGLEVPAWIFIVLLLGCIVWLAYKFFKKVIIPKIEEYIKVKNDIKEIPIIKSNQEKAIQKSMDGDAKLNNRIDEMDEKLDTIVNVLNELKTSMAEQAKNSENQSAGLKTMLASELDKRYRRYLELGYIPDKEFDEYVHMFESYSRLGGNGTGKEKYDYIMGKLERKI